MARRGCLDLIRMLHAVPGIETISMTTNGLLLDGRVREASDAGLTAVNLSLDALDPELYRRMTRGGDVTKVMRVLRDAAACYVCAEETLEPAWMITMEGGSKFFFGLYDAVPLGFTRQ